MRMHMVRRSVASCPLIVGAAALLSIAQVGSVHAQSRFIGVGDLPGGPVYSEAAGVSADGSTVVGFSFGTMGLEGYLWTESGGVTGVGAFDGATGSDAFAVSGDGSVVVGLAFDGIQVQAFRRTSGGELVGLGLLPGASQSAALGISDDGTVVVGRSRVDGIEQPFEWNESDGMTALPLAKGFDGGVAFDASSDGSVVVGALEAGENTPDAARVAVRWVDGAVELLGALEGYDFSTARAVSTDGSVVVGVSETFFDDGVNSSEAFRWTAETGMVSLGDLPGGATLSGALGVSADGGTIVGYAADDGGLAAFIWTEADGIRELATVLTDDVGLDITGWNLEQAVGISADGTVIAGLGFNPSFLNEGWCAIIDDEAPACPADLDGNGIVSGSDLTILLGAWGTDDPVADLDGNGLVSGSDLTILLGAWGDCPR